MKSIAKTSALIIILICFACNSKKTTEGNDPAIKDRIYDKANLLTSSQEDSIFTLIKNLELEIGSQIGVMTIDTLAGRKMEEFSFRKADSLRLGRQNYNDGVLMIIAFRDRSVRIEVGLGLENIIKDEIAAQIIRNDIVPQFQLQKFGQGVYNGISRICELIKANKDMVGQKPN